MSKNLAVHFKSETVEWSTPQRFFDDLNAKYNFTLDPCSTKENAKCKKFYTKEDDGLKQSWGGRLFFVTHHTAQSLKSGWRKHTLSLRNQVQQWYSSYPLALIRLTFTALYTVSVKWYL